MAKGTIIEKKSALITVETAEGNVFISLHKQGTTFLKLSKLKVGDTAEVEVEVSNEGRLYCSESNKVASSRITAKELLLREMALNRQMEGI